MRPYCRSGGTGYIAGKPLKIVIVGLVTTGMALCALMESPPPGSPKPGEPVVGAQGIANLKFRPDDANTRSGFEHLYNLEYDQAVREFELALKAHPDDASATNHLLSGVLFRELYRIGALDTRAVRQEQLSHQQAVSGGSEDPGADQGPDRARLPTGGGAAEGEPQRCGRALRARGDAGDEVAVYRAGGEGMVLRRCATRWERGAITSTCWSWTRSSRDAKMVVGIHNYVVGSINFAIKMAASIVGLSGSKSKGIEYLYAAGQRRRRNVGGCAHRAVVVFAARAEVSGGAEAGGRAGVRSSRGIFFSGWRTPTC